MTPRDAKGRFTTRQHADALAAERLLERAVEEAVSVLRSRTWPLPGAGSQVATARETLLHAGRSAELLLRGVA